MAWVSLFFAGLFEIVWVFFMKQSDGFTRLVPSVITLVTMLASFVLLAYSMRTLPLARLTRYGRGSEPYARSSLVSRCSESTSAPLRLVAAALIVAGIVRMKISTPT
jgi:quaternary ammonium compound-resistance protein SugE